MVTCQNCGQVNTQATNFCRFCGTKIAVNYPQGNDYPQPGGGAYNPPPPAAARNYEQEPPRPYSWKTDEYQVDSERPTRIQQRIEAAQMTPPPVSPQAPAPMRHFAGGQASIGNYHCPRCSTTLLPRIERTISTAGWIVFAALLITFFPLFWIGFLIKEDVRVCPVCRFRMS